jgi:hypothetical protein
MLTSTHGGRLLSLDALVEESGELGKEDATIETDFFKDSCGNALSDAIGFNRSHSPGNLLGFLTRPARTPVAFTNQINHRSPYPRTSKVFERHVSALVVPSCRF